MGTVDIVTLVERLVSGLPDRRQQVLSVLCGAVGDRLADHPEYGIRMSLEPGSRAVDSETQRICVFVHGLMGSPLDWTGPVGEPHVRYPPALEDAFGALSLLAHYNSGLHISTNGRQLADALEAATADARGLAELSLVGHSMGGLVVRSACHYGAAAGHRWVRLVRRVFLLGAPAHGAPLEQVAHVAAFTLEAIWNPWTKIIGKAINLRSAGIKDLRHGFVLDEDWHGRDPDQLRLAAPRVPDVPADAAWFVAAGGLGSSTGIVGKVLGDGLVRAGSAGGVGFGSPEGVLPAHHYAAFPHTSHVNLLRSAEVLEQIKAWWSENGPQSSDSGRIY